MVEILHNKPLHHGLTHVLVIQSIYPILSAFLEIRIFFTALWIISWHSCVPISPNQAHHIIEYHVLRLVSKELAAGCGRRWISRIYLLQCVGVLCYCLVEQLGADLQRCQGCVESFLGRCYGSICRFVLLFLVYGLRYYIFPGLRITSGTAECLSAGISSNIADLVICVR